MGCFSFICQECEKPILSNAVQGQPVKLFLLKNEKVIERMEGDYDSYGRVFDADRKSIDWDMGWNDVCRLMFNDNEDDGIAAVHSACWQGVTPIIQSKNDPDQGWTDSGPYALRCGNAVSEE